MIYHVSVYMYYHALIYLYVFYVMNYLLLEWTVNTV